MYERWGDDKYETCKSCENCTWFEECGCDEICVYFDCVDIMAVRMEDYCKDLKDRAMAYYDIIIELGGED